METKGSEQRHDPGVTEAERGDVLTVLLGRKMERLEGARSDDAVVAGSLGGKEPVVDVPGDGEEIGQVRKPAADADVVGIVDDGLGTKGPIELEVLLDPGALVFDGELGNDPGLDDPGAEGARGGMAARA